jgi:hypothetical protein
MAFEAGGRPCEETVAFIRRMGAAWTLNHKDSPPITGQLWQEVSTLLQLGNAELILSANGF